MPDYTNFTVTYTVEDTYLPIGWGSPTAIKQGIPMKTITEKKKKVYGVADWCKKYYTK